MQTWFDTARFGMFIHWGHSSKAGWELSWPLVGGVFSLPHCQNIGVVDYHANAISFNPKQYNPQEWAKLAKDLGMQYVVLTAKHHDGFALFHTKHSDFSIEQTAYKKDIVGEFVEAMRSSGIRVGLYFSLIDWHHPHYPAFTEADKPYGFDKIPQPTPQQWESYLVFMFGQVRELLTNYGQIDLLWFDGSWERTPEQWRAKELEKMIRQLQPDILINDRLPDCGDFTTPEQFIPSRPPGHRWETCLTINDSWGYNSQDKNFKSARELIHNLCEVAGKGGNLLLNVSPMGDGLIPAELLERLEVIKTWMQDYSESIIDTKPGLEPWQFYGSSTRRENRIYLHLLMKPYDTIKVRGIPIKRVKSVLALPSATPLEYHQRCAIVDSLFNEDPEGELTIIIPSSSVNDYATVIVIEIDE
ncbi:MAG: alpha-L-fucosidase [Crocosphaera sp.]